MTADLDFTTFHNIIDGKPVPASKTRNPINPATAKPLPDAPASGQAELDAAVAAAKKAFPGWAATPMAERGQALTKIGEAFSTHRDAFVKLLVQENGKPTPIAQDEFARTAQMFATVPTLSLPEEVAHSDADKTATVRYVPIGVACALVPWNYPMLLGAGKIAPALFAGNCLVVKPAPETPFVLLKLVELAQRFLPPGVLQILSGGPELGPLFTAHPGIEKVSFTGSIATGKAVMASCAKTLKRCTLELGGNDAAIVCEDVDFASAVPTIAQLSFLHAGQICMDVKRIYVHASIYDKFVAAVVDYAKNLACGTGDEAGAFVGPLQNAAQYERVKGFLAEIESAGYKTALGDTKAAPTRDGYFISPTIVENPPDDARIMRDEQFGPVVPIVKWDCSDEEIVARANEGRYGLGGSVWSKDVERATNMAKKLEVGSAWVNMHFEVQAHVPFGGHKDSGIGMEWGNVGLKHWCNVQSLWVPKAPAVNGS